MHTTTQPIFLLHYPEYIAGVISIEITLTESILIRLQLIWIPKVDCLAYVGENASKWISALLIWKWCHWGDVAICKFRYSHNSEFVNTANNFIRYKRFPWNVNCIYCSICKRMHAHWYELMYFQDFVSLWNDWRGALLHNNDLFDTARCNLKIRYQECSTHKKHIW